ncbi:hypothetical protein X743_33665 [Mesorhizobium sp. LNHC252B00]|nr:hypothetical protein X743_33665 [Mesorhizobium sp. LNHC252B00]
MPIIGNQGARQIVPPILLNPHRGQGQSADPGENQRASRYCPAVGWLTRWRRLVRDYEQRIDVSEAMIPVAMGSLLMRRISH